ncbi:hypothetical protein Ccrd_017687 [Cynara cardunculus var. scolymus]|uniref:Uncharacterized protein n=1 Tax=Cynara cardunculus var. scolymus TaxID=59895 RepID=A0A103Y7M2_CYNCS|nr:hypothetical protein Ccrd_017687 [Cynara cardunculus var. scolymus]
MIWSSPVPKPCAVQSMMQSVYFNPNKFLIGLHDAYVRMMMRMANSRVVLTSGAMSTGYGLNAMSPFGMRPTKEYDDKMIIEMYKALVGHTTQQIS